MLLYVEKEMVMKVLRGFSAIILGMLLVSCADQYDANKRFVAERGAQGIKNNNPAERPIGTPGRLPGQENGGSNGNLIGGENGSWYPVEDCYAPGSEQNNQNGYDPGDCVPVDPPEWVPPVGWVPNPVGPIYPPISYPPVGVVPWIPELPPIDLPGGGIVGEYPPPGGVPSPELCAYRCTGISGEGAGMEPMYASMDPYTNRLTDKSEIWQAHEGAQDKLVCLDLYTIGGTWSGKFLKDWNPSGGDLYSYDQQIIAKDHPSQSEKEVQKVVCT